MSSTRRPLDPRSRWTNAFVDALLGARRFADRLDALIPLDGAPPGEAVVHEEDMAPVDALLGLLSLRKTAALLFAAVLSGTAAPDRDTRSAADWGRDSLR
jgi:hypothetical protein